MNNPSVVKLEKGDKDMTYDEKRIYRGYRYCIDKCRYVFDMGQIKCFVALIFDINVIELNEIIRKFEKISSR